ncbi:imidazole glycerol phosphate synthase subunit HisH [Fibrobacterota bacterium]
MVVIIDYGLGNLRSIHYKLQKSKIESVISSSLQDIKTADKLILPGVGNFATGMANLIELGLIPLLHEKVIDGSTPILGICLGMQLFSLRSDEGGAEGLGWIDGETRRFDFNGRISNPPIPHVGWNTITVKNRHDLLEDISEDQEFYFTHSYHVCCKKPEQIAAVTDYGYEFVSAVCRGNIFGTQFHPEKSHRRGFEIIKNFALS